MFVSIFEPCKLFHLSKLKGHRGHNKAMIALCKMLLTDIWNILSSGEVYNPSGYILQTSRPAPEKKV